mgnify:CR=1 FL=1
MSNTNDGGPAFARPASTGNNYLTGETDAPVDSQSGMSLRDYFAGHALQGLVNLRGANVKHETELAYLYADEMLIVRAALKGAAHAK